MRKLTEADKQEILKLYRESAETTSTLAERYDVSNSTISRLLKSTLPEDEYEYLVSLKRAARTPEGRAQVSYDNVPNMFAQGAGEDTLQPPQPKIKEKPRYFEEEEEEDNEDLSAARRVRRRSSAKYEEPIAQQLELLDQPLQDISSIDSSSFQTTHPEATVLASMLGEDLLDESEDDLDDLLEDDDEDDEDFDDDDFEPLQPLVTRRSRSAAVQVLPLSAASLPKTCYLVIDRASELITRPLRDFGDLGQIPTVETQQRTLPVFDNHRVAKRFSTKRDRVIKIPDSKMLQKARYHLQAKGITRLLIDGQVYSISPV